MSTVAEPQVETQVEAQEAKGSRGKKPRPDFRKENSIADDVKFSAIPDGLTVKHATLSLKDFDNELSFAKYRAWHLEKRIEEMTKERESVLEEISDMEKYDSDDKRSAVASAKKAQKKFLATLEDLKSMNIDVEDLLRKMQENL